MTASAFLRSWTSIRPYHNQFFLGVEEKLQRLIRVMPLRSPMSIFSKSTDLEKCEAGDRE